MHSSMALKPREQRLQLAAASRGLKLICDRYSPRYAAKRYFLRPIWDARKTLRPTPGGGCALVKGRRVSISLMSLDEVESLLDGWIEPKPNAPARLPWQAGIVAASERKDG